jgi:hypothetical protein
LEVWEARDETGQVSYPRGRDAKGYLTYTGDGYMFGAIMSTDRAPFATADLVGGTPTEQASAARTYTSYCGTYDLMEGIVVHHIEISLFPNWVGVDQERIIEVNDDHLTLSTAPLLVDGRRQVNRLIWTRAR